MTLDYKKLASDLLGIARAVTPLVGLDDELNAGIAVAEKVIETINNVKGSLDQDDQAALQPVLDELVVRVNAHAPRTINSLG